MALRRLKKKKKKPLKGHIPKFRTEPDIVPFFNAENHHQNLLQFYIILLRKTERNEGEVGDKEDPCPRGISGLFTRNSRMESQ